MIINLFFSLWWCWTVINWVIAAMRCLREQFICDLVSWSPNWWVEMLFGPTRNSDKGVEITFLGTRTGLSRTKLFVPVDQLSNQWVVPIIIIILLIMAAVTVSLMSLAVRSLLRDFLTAEDKEGVFNADHFPLWYKRAAEQVPGTFVYSIPFSTGTQQRRSSWNKLHQRRENDSTLHRRLIVPTLSASTSSYWAQRRIKGLGSLAGCVDESCRLPLQFVAALITCRQSGGPTFAPPAPEREFRHRFAGLLQPLLC